MKNIKMVAILFGRRAVRNTTNELVPSNDLVRCTENCRHASAEL